MYGTAKTTATTAARAPLFEMNRDTSVRELLWRNAGDGGHEGLPAGGRPEFCRAEGGSSATVARP